jgi:hypothetical protein
MNKLDDHGNQCGFTCACTATEYKCLQVRVVEKVLDSLQGFELIRVELNLSVHVI